MDQPGEILAALPVRGFQGRLQRELRDVPDAEIGYGQAARRDGEQVAEAVEIEDADPADTEGLGTRGEPEVLDGAHGGVDVGGKVGLTAEAAAEGPLAVASDADVQGRVENPREFE